MTSPLSTMDHQLKKKDIVTKISKEFCFFDRDYFQDNYEAWIRIYYTGHGEIDQMITPEDGQVSLSYSDLIKAIKKSAEHQTR